MDSLCFWTMRCIGIVECLHTKCVNYVGNQIRVTDHIYLVYMRYWYFWHMLIIDQMDRFQWVIKLLYGLFFWIDRLQHMMFFLGSFFYYNMKLEQCVFGSGRMRALMFLSWPYIFLGVGPLPLIIIQIVWGRAIIAATLWCWLLLCTSTTWVSSILQIGFILNKYCGIYLQGQSRLREYHFP